MPMKPSENCSVIYGIFLISFLILSSCGNDTGTFYDIDAVNTTIHKSIGIDILEFKKKTDLKLKANPEYYRSEIEAMCDGADMDMFASFGFKTTKDNGRSIAENDVKNIIELMLASLSNGIMLENCNSTKNQDSTCFWKNQIIDWVDSENSESRYIDYSQLSQEFYALYTKNHLTEEEFNYIVVFLYIMVSIDCIDNPPPPIFNWRVMDKMSRTRLKTQSAWIMKQTIAPAIIIGLIILSFVLRSNPGYETSITHLSLLLSISILVCIAFILIKYYKLNLRDESKTFLGFKTKTIEFKRSALIFFIGPIVSILFASFVLTPLSTFTLTQLNSSEAYPLNNQKNRIIKVYETGRRPKNPNILCLNWEARR